MGLDGWRSTGRLVAWTKVPLGCNWSDNQTGQGGIAPLKPIEGKSSC